jgi:hypothetical protein
VKWKAACVCLCDRLPRQSFARGIERLQTIIDHIALDYEDSPGRFKAAILLAEFRQSSSSSSSELIRKSALQH